MTTFRTSRVFAAPRDAVFAAFEDPGRLARWWGPDGFHNTFEVFDFRPGGVWRFTMHGPNGASFLNEASSVAVDPARKIVIRHLSSPHFQLTIGLESHAAGTLVIWEQAFDDAAVAESLRHICEPANEQNLSRWQAMVANAGAGAA